MKRLLLCLSVMFLLAGCAVSQEKPQPLPPHIAQKNLSIDSEISVNYSTAAVTDSQLAKLAVTGKWQAVNPTKAAKDDLAVFVRVLKMEPEMAHLEFLFVELGSPKILAMPKMSVKWNKTAELTINEPDGKFLIKVKLPRNEAFA